MITETTELAVTEPPKDLTERAADKAISPFTVETLVERVELVKEAMRRCMEEDLHYGKIPGCGKKPTLLKPGAEMLGTLFNLGQRYRFQERLLPGDHVVYTVTCTQFYRPTGADIADGLGACSSMEYKWRVQCEPRTLDNGKVIPPKYTAHDFLNNALKIAAKRALVASIINATGVSSLFNQDIEEDPDKYREQGQQPARKPNPPAPRPQQANGNGNGTGQHKAAGKLERIQGFVSRAWDNDYQGKHYWFAKLDQARQLQTTDPELGNRLAKYQTGQAITVMGEPSPKPGKYYLKSIESAPVTEEQPESDDLNMDEPYEATP